LFQYIYSEKKKKKKKKKEKEEEEARITVPEQQIVVVSSSKAPPGSNEGVHATKNIFAAMAKARQPEHEDLKPRS
jgi:hypothetical protein